MRVRKFLVIAIVALTTGTAFGLNMFEFSNGWGTPGMASCPTVVYVTTDDYTSCFQFMICYDPTVLHFDSVSLFGIEGVQTVFDTAWGGGGPDFFNYWVDSTEGWVEFMTLYDFHAPPIDHLGPMDRTPVCIFFWTVDEDAPFPATVPLVVSEACGTMTFDCVFGDTLGLDVPADTLLPGIFYLVPPGDANGNGEVTFIDLVYLEQFLYESGPSPAPTGDANADCAITEDDLTYLALYMFDYGNAPLNPSCPWEKWASPSPEILKSSLPKVKHPRASKVRELNKVIAPNKAGDKGYSKN